MLNALSAYFSTEGFMPHGHCFLWTPALLWLYVAADSIIAASYYSIPFALWYFVRKRSDLPFRWIFILFGVFVMACGTTHIFSIVNIWEPSYWADASVKVLTAFASVVTAILIWPLIPKALALPSPEQLQVSNTQLTDEIERRRHIEAELVRSNEALQERTKQLEVVNQELEAFSYSVSHDLRAPLRHVNGYSSILLKDTTIRSQEEKKHLENIQRAAKTMGDLIDDLLRFSHASRMAVSVAPVDLNAVVDEVRKECDASSMIEWKLGHLPSVRGDVGLLRVAFTNLISNAIKFSGKRANPIIQIDAQPANDNEVIVFVKDNGAGFDPRFQNKLFGVFQRLHSEEEFEGTGIGLATVRRVIEKLGGRIWADGKIDEGATFFIALQRA